MSRASRVLIIDPAARTVHYDCLDVKAPAALQKAIGGWIEGAYCWPSGDVLYVDEEGLLKPSMHFFRLACREDPQPLAGRGIVVGRELIKGDKWIGNADVALLIEELRGMITWLSRVQVEAWAKGNASEPMCTITTVHDGVATTEVISRVGEVFESMPKPE